jgi:ABC-type multidrug transport system ATPase subunit
MSTHHSGITAAPHNQIEIGMNGLLLEARNLSKSYRKGDRQVRNISLPVRPGEIITLISPDGGDPTLLLEILSGQNKPSEGEVLIGGVDLYKDRTALRKKVGFVPRALTVHQNLTTYEALDYAGRLRLAKGTTPTYRRQRVDDVLAVLDLNAQRNLRVRALDPEQRKRVSIGVELITNPSILCLDDPVAGFTPHEEVKLMQALIKIAGQGQAIILTTRSVSSLRFADRTAIILAGGYLAWFGPEKEALGFFSNYNHPIDGNGKVHAFAGLFDVLGNPTSEAQEWVNAIALTRPIKSTFRLLRRRNNLASCWKN